MTQEVSLREYVERLILEHEKAQEAQRRAAEKALDAASRELAARLETMNEFRQQIDRERALYVRADNLKSLTDRIEMIERWQSRLIGIGLAIMAVSAIIAAFAKLIGK